MDSFATSGDPEVGHPHVAPTRDKRFIPPTKSRSNFARSLSRFIPNQTHEDSRLHEILHAQSFKNPVKNKEAFIRGCMYIMRGLQNMPYSKSFPSSPSNLFFFKVRE